MTQDWFAELVWLFGTVGLEPAAGGPGGTVLSWRTVHADNREELLRSCSSLRVDVDGEEGFPTSRIGGLEVAVGAEGVGPAGVAVCLRRIRAVFHAADAGGAGVGDGAAWTGGIGPRREDGTRRGHLLRTADPTLRMPISQDTDSGSTVIYESHG